MHCAVWGGRLTRCLLLKPAASDLLSKKGSSNVDAGHEQRQSLHCFAHEMQRADVP